MGTPLYTTDIIPMTSRPTLTVMDDGDYFVILDTSTGKISKILKTNIMTALKISYDNTTSGLTATQVQAALDELVVNLGSSDSAISALSGRLDTLEGTGEGSVAKAIDDALEQIETDKTLTVSGMAADAKVTGDKVGELKSALNDRVQKDLYGNYQIYMHWTTGVFEANGYTNSSNVNYCHSGKLSAGKYKIEPQSGYYAEIYSYVSDSSGTHLYGMTGNTVTFTASAPFVISSRKNPTAAITDAEKLAYNDNIKISLIVNDRGMVDDVNDLEDLGLAHTKDEILMDGLIFFYYTQRPTITKNSDRSFTVTVPANPRGIYAKNGELLPISGSITSATYNVPSSSYFVYNIGTGLFSVMTYQEINASTAELILLFHNQNGYLYGQWERFVLEDGITSAIAECKAYANDVSGSGMLPSYYDSYLPSKMETIRGHIANAGNRGVSFVFISDIHYDADGTNNMRKSPLLIQAISRQTPVKRMICGGDMITIAAGSKDAGMALEQETITDFRVKTKMDTFWTVGNHEYNNPGNDPSLVGQQLTINEIYPFVTQGNSQSITKFDSTGAYYVDDPKDKVRFLFTACNLDSSVNTDSITWLIEQLPSTPTDYDIVLISHLGIYYNPTSEVYTGAVDAFKPILQALQAYKSHTTFIYDDDVNYDFSGKTGTVLGAFLGHYHVDGSGTWYNIPCIIITTDSLNQRAGTLTRTAGTTTEQAFDVVTIDRDAETIYCTRIGAGSDRSVSYS